MAMHDLRAELAGESLELPVGRHRDGPFGPHRVRRSLHANETHALILGFIGLAGLARRHDHHLVATSYHGSCQLLGNEGYATDGGRIAKAERQDSHMRYT